MATRLSIISALARIVGDDAKLWGPPLEYPHSASAAAAVWPTNPGHPVSPVAAVASVQPVGWMPDAPTATASGLTAIIARRRDCLCVARDMPYRFGAESATA